MTRAAAVARAIGLAREHLGDYVPTADVTLTTSREPTTTATPAVTVTATDWPGHGHLAGRRDPVSIPGTADLLVDGTQVTVALWLDDGTPYVADAPECLTIAQCDAIDRAVAAAWDERCADELDGSYDTGRGWREVA